MAIKVIPEQLIEIQNRDSKGRSLPRRASISTIASYIRRSRTETLHHTEQQATAAGLTVEQYIQQEIDSELERAERQGHDKQWVHLNPVALYGDVKRYEAEDLKWKDALRVSVGDVLELDGVLYALQSAPNGNYRLHALAGGLKG